MKISNLTLELDKIADEIQVQDPTIALAIDKISDALENPKKKIDPSTLTDEQIKKMKVHLRVRTARYVISSETLHMLKEAGLKEDFDKIFSKGKATWFNLWNKIKDKTLMAEIKALNSVHAIKEFLKKNPAMKWTVLSAIALGLISLPLAANVDIISPSNLIDLVTSIDIDIVMDPSGFPSLEITIDDSWIQEVAQESMMDAKSKEQLKSNLKDSLMEILTEKYERSPLKKVIKKEQIIPHLQRIIKEQLWPKILKYLVI